MRLSVLRCCCGIRRRRATCGDPGKDHSQQPCPNGFLFAGEESQDAGIQRTKLEVRRFHFSVEQSILFIYHYKLGF